MKYLLLLSILFTSASFAITRDELKTGDILLLPLNCRLCTMIEVETDSPYSHSGVVLRDTSGEIFIAQALKSVHSIPYEQFLKMKDRTRSIKVMRPKELMHNSAFKRAQLISNYHEVFKNAAFDYAYLWDNYDQDGRETYYCSEFITKLINTVLSDKMEPAPHYYTNNLDDWERYFGGTIPQGVVSNSPADFERYPQMIDLGFLK